MSWDAWADEALGALEARVQRRSLAPLAPGPSAVEVTRAGRPLVLFSGNDYLGLSAHPRVRAAAADAAARHGMGPRGSALICGWAEPHRALADALAARMGAAAGLLLPTGFAANLATLGALAGPDLCIVSDALNHASIIDGCRLARHAGAEVRVVAHADLEAFDAALARSERPRKLIVSDALFSMDGDRAPLAGLVDLKRRHRALLMLDEAHALLVLGPGGGGLADEAGLAAAVDLRVATLSKAVGAQGAVLVADPRWCDLVVNRGRAFMFSTALPLPVVAAAHEALRVDRDEPRWRTRLSRHVDRVARALGRDPARATPIVPIPIGGEREALAAADRLQAAGLHVVAVRPPTVPPGTSRLRVALSAAHSEAHVDALLTALADLTGR